MLGLEPLGFDFYDEIKEIFGDESSISSTFATLHNDDKSSMSQTTSQASQPNEQQNEQGSEEQNDQKNDRQRDQQNEQENEQKCEKGLVTLTKDADKGQNSIESTTLLTPLTANNEPAITRASKKRVRKQTDVNDNKENAEVPKKKTSKASRPSKTSKTSRASKTAKSSPQKRVKNENDENKENLPSSSSAATVTISETIEKAKLLVENISAENILKQIQDNKQGYEKLIGCLKEIVELAE